MGAARIAPGLALLLCCPVLSSAYALVSPPPALQGWLRACTGVPGGGGVSRAQSLGFPKESEVWVGVPSDPGSSLPAVSGVSELWALRF